ncbi:MAG TPA: AMP-binding protein [Planktothrix sp.]|jgi:long-chain acyl-CoA synthetase
MKSSVKPASEQKQAPAATLVSLIDGLEQHGQRPVFLHFEKGKPVELEYSELLHYVRRLAAGLAEKGLKTGDSVLMLAANSPQWVIGCLAVLYAGGVAVPVDPRHGDEALAHIITDSGAKWAFCDERAQERLHKVLPERRLHLLRLDDPNHPKHWKKALSRSKATPFPADAEQRAILFYTSGTTGMPKGVPLSHENILMQIDSVLVKLGLLKKGDRLLLPLPFYHVYPLDLAILGPLRMGLTIIMPKSLTGPDIVHALKAGRATVLVAVPGLLRALYAGIEGRFKSPKILASLFAITIAWCKIVRTVTRIPLGKIVFKPVRNAFAPTLRLLCSGGALLDADLAANLIALGWDVAVGYGLTETAPLLAVRMPNNYDLASVGKPIPGVQVRTKKIDLKEEQAESTESAGAREKEASDPRKVNLAAHPETDKEILVEGNNGVEKAAPKANPNEGEIQARGPNIFAGYLNLPDKSAEAFDQDGWFKTGDLGYFAGENLRITGRASTTIVMEGGKKIQPDDLERKFEDRPGIREIAILKYDRKLVALVVPRLNAAEKGKGDETISKSISQVSSSLPSYLRISDFAVTRQPLPRTNLGKLKRHELEELYEKAKSAKRSGQSQSTAPMSIDSMSEADSSLLQEPVAQQTWQWLCEKFPNSGLTMDSSPQLDLNIDSLEWMNLTLEMQERTGVEIGEEAIARIETVRDLLREVIDAEHSGKRIEGSPLTDPEKFISEKQARWLRPLAKWQEDMARAFYRANRRLFQSYCHLEPVDAEKIPEGQVVFIPNHSSYCDAFVLAAALDDKRLRNTFWAGWTGIAFGNPLFRAGSRLAKGIPIDAKGSLVSSLALGAAVLKRGKSLVWFPEGERTLTGKLLDFKPGIGMILSKHEVPIVPVYLDGAREALPPGDFRLHHVKVRVIFGDPVMPSQLKEEGKGNTDNERIADALRTRVQALSRRAHHGN